MNAPLYVLHLERDKNRLRHIKHHMMRRLPSLQIWLGIDGALKNKADNVLSRYGMHCTSGGAAGLWASYLTFYQFMIDTKIKETIIFQDDVRIERNFMPKVAKIKKHIKSDYLMCRLGRWDYALLVSQAGAQEFMRLATNQGDPRQLTDTWAWARGLITPPVPIRSIKNSNRSYHLAISTSAPSTRIIATQKHRKLK